MADYIDVHPFWTDGSDLLKRAEVAVAVSIEAIRSGEDTAANGWSESPDYATAHAARMSWAAVALQNGAQYARAALKMAIAQNIGLTVAQITGASDGALQTNVNDAVDLLSQG